MTSTLRCGECGAAIESPDYFELDGKPACAPCTSPHLPKALGRVVVENLLWLGGGVVAFALGGLLASGLGAGARAGGPILVLPVAVWGYFLFRGGTDKDVTWVSGDRRTRVHNHQRIIGAVGTALFVVAAYIVAEPFLIERRIEVSCPKNQPVRVRQDSTITFTSLDREGFAHFEVRVGESVHELSFKANNEEHPAGDLRIEPVRFQPDFAKLWVYGKRLESQD
ncbi:MAG: hypothetical protein HY791_07770 [Deltaproteobacteria bacterium]|nr:hypothetical protein [Deltaproteobacteria bacterium]